MRATIIKKAGVFFLMCCGTLLLVPEAKAQSQEKKKSNKMEKTEESTATLQLKVKGMSCQAGCANGIDSMLKQQDGIVKSKTTFDSGASEIVYDKRKISEEQIMRLIEGRGFSTKKE